MGKTRIKSSGLVGDRHAKKYFSNSLIVDEYTLASNTSCKELPREVKVKVTNPPEKKDDKWFVEINNKFTVPTSCLYKPFTTNMLKAEDHTFDNLTNKIETIKQETGTNSIKLLANTFCTPVEISTVQKVNGYQKADIVFVDTVETPVMFTSLKKTYHTRGTWGYGGIASKKKHPAVVEFLEKLNITEHPEKQSFALKLNPKKESHRDLILMQMYGNDYGSISYGINNVNNIVFGEIDLDLDYDSYYYMKAEKILYNGELDTKQLYIQSNFAADRNDCGIRNALVQLRHEGSRKVTKFV